MQPCAHSLTYSLSSHPKALLKEKCESKFLMDTEATLKERVKQSNTANKSQLSESEVDSLSQAVGSAMDAGIEQDAEYLKKAKDMLWEDAERKLRGKEMDDKLKQWKVSELGGVARLVVCLVVV